MADPSIFRPLTKLLPVVIFRLKHGRGLPYNIRFSVSLEYYELWKHNEGTWNSDGKLPN